MSQRELTEWTAGFFDGDGTINAYTGKQDEHTTSHQVHASCSVGSTYVAGIFDAEGCVMTEIGPKDSYNIGYSSKTACRMNHLENDPLVRRLTEFCESINVSYTVNHTEKDGNRGDIFTFAVRERSDVETFLRELIPYLTVKQEQAKIMVNDIIPLLNQRAQSSRRGFLRVMHHIDRMNAMKGGNRGKYNLEYFEDLWGMEYDPTRYE